MSLRPVAALAAAAAALAIGGCAKDAELKVVAPTGNAAFMERYVALGNSITAGYQSGGINDSTQLVAYPALIARAAGTRYVAPLLSRPGCPGPFVNFLTQERVGGASAPPCALRTAAAASHDAEILNNVAVPGAATADIVGAAGANYNALHQFILGGRSQVDRALDADPTFASVWIGNNDVLGFALSGTTTGATEVATFQQNYDALVNRLRSRNPNLRGLLIGVVDVTNTALLIPVAALVASPQLQGAVAQVVGRPLQFLPNCTATTTALVSFPTFTQLRALGQQLPPGAPVPFACEPTTLPGVPIPLGAAGVLDAGERTFFATRVAAYNAYIRAKADQIGFAYYDPNPTLLALKANGSIPVFPNLQNPTQAFGPFVSNDGVHPGTQAHLRLATEMIQAINTKYSVTIPAPTLP